jgi:hypothetical protein
LPWQILKEIVPGINPAQFYIQKTPVVKDLCLGGNDILRLGAFLAINQGELDLLAFVQGPVAIASDLAVVDKNIRAVFNCDKAIALG